MKKEIVKIVSLLVILVLTLNTIVMATTKSELQNEKKQNQEKINEAKEELDGIHTEKTETLKEVENISSQISSFEDEISQLNTKIDELSEKITDAEGNLQKAQEDYTKQENLLKERLIATYEAGQTSYLDVILSSKSLTDFISNYYLVTQIADNDKALMEKIQNQKKEIETTKQELESNKNEVATSKESKEAKQKQLTIAKKEKNTYVEKLSEDEKKTQAEIDQLEEDNRKIAAEISAAEKKYKDKLKGFSNTFVGAGNGYLQVPVQSGSISATMYYSSGSFHGALDYAVSSGTPVYAAAEGVVMSIQHLSGSYGEHLVIRHPNGLQTYYAHGNGTFYVSAGQSVSKGQLIMLSGNTGNSEGPHLHFEVRVPPYSHNSSCCVDPRNYY